MKWSVYDTFDKAGAWPGDKWVKPDIGAGEVWDATTELSNPGAPDNSLSFRIPKFTLYRPPSHGKAMILSTKTTTVGDTESFGVKCDMAVEIYGTDPNPFGVSPNDPRLAMGGMVILDGPTGLVLDFLATNDRIYPVYERLAYAQASLGPYPAFTDFLRTDLKTQPGEWHNLEIRYDSSDNHAEWWLDGKKVAEQSHIGAPIGATEPVVKLKSVRFGGALFTMMDGGVPRPADWPFATKQMPSLLKKPEDELFGQGGKIGFRNFQVGS